MQTIFGILGGIGTDPEDLMHMKRTADRLFGNDYVWCILGAGRHQTNLITMGAIMGGNVRTGMEDSIYLGKGELAKTNAELVAKIVRILASSHWNRRPRRGAADARPQGRRERRVLASNEPRAVSSLDHGRETPCAT